MASASDPKDTVKDVVASIQKELQRVQQPRHESSHEPCIYRVPRRLRKANEDAYTPQIVSIGPYHRGSQSLQAMEDVKLRYLLDYLSRKPKHSLDSIVEDLNKVEESARQCYGESIQNESNEFVKMMLIDGCFIIELLHKPQGGGNQIKDMVEGDLLLLENQLPFFILELLFTGSDKLSEADHFLQLTLEFFHIQKGMGKGFAPNPKRPIKHFVDLILQYYVSSPSRMEPAKGNGTCRSIPNAAELHEAGVKFKKGTGNRYLGPKFSNGIFEIPTLRVEGRTELLLRNLIAYEQCCGIEGYITHYAVLMDFLINSPNDVALLRRYGIIDNWIGDNEQVSHLFNKICSGVITNSSKNHFYGLCEDVNAYYKTPWHAFRALLERDYFNSPWSIISCVAVSLILVCTIIQTICSVISVNK